MLRYTNSIPSIDLRFPGSFVKIDVASAAYEVLRKGVVERQTRGNHYERIMKVMCNAWEAQMLLNLANQFYPDIAPDIARHLARANQAVN